MTNYCPTCKKLVTLNKKGRCSLCRGRTKEPESGDFVYLGTADFYFSASLEDLLNQNQIPFIKVNVFGAIMAFIKGPMSEQFNFYVPFEVYQQAKELYDEFSE